MPDLKTAIGVAESQMLSEFLEIVARDYKIQRAREHYQDNNRTKYLKRMADEARDWAKTVKPVPVGGWK